MTATTTATTFTARDAERARKAVQVFAYDASHAWLVVSLDDETGFPEAMQFASRFSYVNLMGSNFAGDVYLEEDLDALAFIKTFGIDVATVSEFELPENNSVRTWPTGKADPETTIAFLR